MIDSKQQNMSNDSGERNLYCDLLHIRCCISKRALVLERVLVGLVLHDAVRGQVQDSLDSVSNADCDLVIGGSLVPNGEDVFSVADRDDDATNF